MVDTDDRQTGGTIPLLISRVADLHCAVRGARVIEVMRVLAIEPLAGMPAFLLGVSIIRGLPVPVVDAGSLLKAANSRAAYFITLDVGGRPVALAVDEIIGVRRIADDALLALPPLLRNAADDAVAAIRASDGELFLLLDTARLVPAHLLAALQQAQAR